MSSIPVPAPEAPAAPSSSNLVPVLVARIGTAVSIALGVYAAAHADRSCASTSPVLPPERQRRQRWLQSRLPWPSSRL